MVLLMVLPHHTLTVLGGCISSQGPPCRPPQGRQLHLRHVPPCNAALPPLHRLPVAQAVYTAAVLGAMCAEQTKLHLAALPRHYRALLLMGPELTDSNIHFRIMSDMTALPSSSPLLHAIITILGVSQMIQRCHWGALLGGKQQAP